MKKFTAALLGAIFTINLTGTALALPKIVDSKDEANEPVRRIALPGETRSKASGRNTETVRRVNFPSTMPDDIDTGSVKRTEWKIASPFTSAIMPSEAVSDSVTILGTAEASKQQMVDYIKSRNKKPKLNCSVEDIVDYYYDEAGKEGIRADVALCQALKETGFFNYGGDVLPKQNNFCGLGATGGGAKGATFKTPRLGVRAHIQHLLAYTSTKKPSEKIVDPRYAHIRDDLPAVFGKVKTWTGLNGIWAVPGKRYGQDILTLWRQAKAPEGNSRAKEYANELVDEGAAGGHLYRGVVDYRQGKYSAAIDDFSAAIDEQKTAEAYYNRALAYFAAGNADKARKDYDSAIKLNPEFEEAVYNRGVIYLNKKNYKKAIADFERMLELVPQSADAKNNIAIAYLKQKKYTQGWTALYEAGRINTTNETVTANQKLLLSCVRN